MQRFFITLNNFKEETTEPLVFDSGASAHFYPTAFDEESPNDGSQDHRIIIATGRELNESLLSIGTLVRPGNLLTRRVNRNGRITQMYARTTCHVRLEQPSLTQIRLSVAGNIIRTADISSNYLHIPFDTPLAELPAAVRQYIG